MGTLGAAVQRPLTNARVVLLEKQNPRIPQSARAEGDVRMSGRTIRARVDAETMALAVDALAERLQEQLRRHIDRLETRSRVPADVAPGEWRRGAWRPPRLPRSWRAASEREVVRRKSFALEPMSAVEAAADMTALDHDFFLFRDADTGADSVIYRRDDDRLAVIAPQDAPKVSGDEGPIREPSRYSEPLDLAIPHHVQHRCAAVLPRADPAGEDVRNVQATLAQQRRTAGRDGRAIDDCPDTAVGLPVEAGRGGQLAALPGRGDIARASRCSLPASAPAARSSRPRSPLIAATPVTVLACGPACPFVEQRRVELAPPVPRPGLCWYHPHIRGYALHVRAMCRGTGGWATRFTNGRVARRCFSRSARAALPTLHGSVWSGRSLAPARAGSVLALDFDPAGLGLRCLRQTDGQDAVSQLGVDISLRPRQRAGWCGRRICPAAAAAASPRPPPP